MSELTQCCYCALKDMRRPLSKMSRCERSCMEKYHKPGDRVYLRVNAEMGGFDVYRVRKGDKLKPTDPDKDKKSQWVAWFGNLSDHCIC